MHLIHTNEHGIRYYNMLHILVGNITQTELKQDKNHTVNSKLINESDLKKKKKINNSHHLLIHDITSKCLCYIKQILKVSCSVHHTFKRIEL